MIALFAAAIIAVIALIHSLQQRVGAERLADMREDHRPDEKLVDPDERFHLELILQNTGRHYILFAQLEEHLTKAFTVYGQSGHTRTNLEGGKDVAFSTWLRPHQEVIFRIPVSISARGLYTLSHLKVSSGDFLGMDEQVRYFGQFRAVVVAPREVSDARFADVLSSFLGDISVRRFILEDPILTAGFREYTGHEPMKNISWTQCARGLGLMVKKFDYTAQPRVSVLLNTDSDTDEREQLLEKCYSIARTVCRILEEQGVQYDFTTNSELAGFADGATHLVGEGLGEHHFTAVLDCLGRSTYQNAFTAEQLLTRAVDSDLTRGRILITPSDDFASSKALVRLQELSGDNLLILQSNAV